MALPVLGLVGGLISGAASLASGAMSLGGSVIGAGATSLLAAASAARTAAIVGGGAIKAATGLAKGVGKAVGVEADQSTSDGQGAKALPPGVKLNKNGVMVQAKGAKGGGQVLPGQFDDGGNLMSLDDRLGSMEAPDRSDAGPVQQILDFVKVIAANTSRTAAGIGTLATGIQQSKTQGGIDDSKKGTGNDGGSAGFLSKTFGAVGKTLKAVGSSLGKTAKFMLKGLGIAGVLYLFISKKDEIQTAIAGVFEYFHNFAKELKNSDDPLQLIFDKIKSIMKKLGEKIMTMFESFYKETVEPLFDKMMNKMSSFIEDLIGSVKMYINETTGYQFFDDVSGDSMISIANRKMKEPTNRVSQMMEKYSPEVIAQANNPNMNKRAEALIAAGFDPSNAQVMGDMTDTKNAVTDMFKVMINLSRASKGRIQWTGIMDDLSKAAAQTNLNSPWDSSKATSMDVINATPVIDGVVYDSWSVLNKNSDSYFGGLENNLGLPAGTGDAARAAYVEKFAEKSRIANSINFRTNQMKNKTMGVGGGQNLMYEDTEKFMSGVLSGDSRQRFFGSENTIAADRLLLEKLDNEIAHFDASAEFYKSAKDGSSIHTHDHHLEKLLKPVAKAFENGGGSSVMIDSSSNDNSIKKQGDTVMMPLDVHHSDRTASAFHEWKYA